MHTIVRLVLLVALSAVMATAQQSTSPAAGGSSGALTVTIPAFAAGAEIPAQYTCKGANTSPAINWSGAPDKAASFAIIVDDPDAPGGTFTHWLIWNLPKTSTGLPDAVPKRDSSPDGWLQGRNDFHKVGYGGPCPPGGATHHYYFRVYALDSKLDVPPGAGRSSLDGAMKGHIVGQAEYMGTFHK